MESQSTTANWGAGQKILFRFFAAYLIVYMIPFPVDYITRGLWLHIASTFDPIVVWTGKHLFHISVNLDYVQNGSGDTSYAYVQQFLFIACSTIACVIWTIADRKRTNYEWLLYRLAVYVRCYLGFFLLVYGAAKFSHSQFPPPSLYRLSQPYGDSSPMGLAWTFLGYSTGYNYFMGFFECIGGLLLLFRRTTLLGACIGAAVLLNVVMINLCFDVPVKLFSVNLFFMALFIVGTSGRRIINFFVLNIATDPDNLNVRFEQRGWRIAGLILKSLYLIIFVFSLLPHDTHTAKDDTTKTPLYGLYIAQAGDQFTRAMPDSVQWSKLVIQHSRTTLEMQDNKRRHPTFELDTLHKQLKMSLFNKTYDLHYKIEDSCFVFYGKYGSDPVCVKMKRYDESRYLLTSRGFHWINEYPFNR